MAEKEKDDEERRAKVEEEEIEEEDVEMDSASSDEELEELPEAPHAPIHPSLGGGGGDGGELELDIPENKDIEENNDIEPSVQSNTQSLQSDLLRQPNLPSTAIPVSPSYSIVSASASNAAANRTFDGCSQISNYTIEKKIGSGTFGEVSLGRDKRNGARVALKRILIHNQKEGMPMTAMREIRILKRISHPNIIKLREMAVKRGQKGKERASTYMIFPYMEHDLDGLLQNPQVKFSVEQVKSYMQQLLKGIEHLHLNNILHRDIKSANILISNSGYLKVADFGLARPYNPAGGRYTNMVVTRWFRPPELLMGATSYDGAVDMWGVGCVFGEILKRRAILPGTSDLDQLNLIWQLCGTPDSKNWPGKGYLEYPMFAEGHVKDFDASTALPRTLEEKFPSHHFRKETYNLLDDLLAICPARRMTASEALNAKYFKVPPYPAKPGTNEFSIFADSHELDSRNAKLSRMQSKSKFILHNHHDVIRPRKDHHHQSVPSSSRSSAPPPPYLKRSLDSDNYDDPSRSFKKPAYNLDDGGL